MKNTNKVPTGQPIQDVVKKSLFDSIVDNEMRGMNDFECQKHANRVGFIFKVLYGRDLWKLRTEFETQLTSLIRDFSSRIENELHQTKEDN